MRTEAGRRVTQTDRQTKKKLYIWNEAKTHVVFDGVSDNGGSETVAYSVVWIRI